MMVPEFTRSSAGDENTKPSRAKPNERTTNLICTRLRNRRAEPKLVRSVAADADSGCAELLVSTGDPAIVWSGADVGSAKRDMLKAGNTMLKCARNLNKSNTPKCRKSRANSDEFKQEKTRMGSEDPGMAFSSTDDSNSKQPIPHAEDCKLECAKLLTEAESSGFAESVAISTTPSFTELRKAEEELICTRFGADGDDARQDIPKTEDALLICAKLLSKRGNPVRAKSIASSRTFMRTKLCANEDASECAKSSTSSEKREPGQDNLSMITKKLRYARLCSVKKLPECRKSEAGKIASDR